MADFTGIIPAFTATYDSTNDKVDVVDATNYAGQGFTRSTADIIFFGNFKYSTGGIQRTTITADTVDPLTVSDWDDDMSAADDGWYEYALVYAFDFAETGGTHEFGDVVRDNGIYYIYISPVPSSAALTDTGSWEVLSFDNYQTAKIEVLAELFITRRSEKCVFDANVAYIRAYDCNCDIIANCKTLTRKRALLYTAQGLWEQGKKTEAQSNIELLTTLCCA